MRLARRQALPQLLGVLPHERLRHRTPPDDGFFGQSAGQRAQLLREEHDPQRLLEILLEQIVLLRRGRVEVALDLAASVSDASPPSLSTWPLFRWYVISLPKTTSRNTEFSYSARTTARQHLQDSAQPATVRTSNIT